MTKVRAGFPSRAKVTGLDRLKAEPERVVQPRQVCLGHLVITIREDQIDVPFRQPGWRVAGDATIFNVNTDRLHSTKPTLPDASRKCRSSYARECRI